MKYPEFDCTFPQTKSFGLVLMLSRFGTLKRSVSYCPAEPTRIKSSAFDTLTEIVMLAWKADAIDP